MVRRHVWDTGATEQRFSFFRSSHHRNPVRLGSSPVEFARGAVLLQHCDAAVGLGAAGGPNERTDRGAPGGVALALEAQGSPRESHPGQAQRLAATVELERGEYCTLPRTSSHPSVPHFFIGSLSLTPQILFYIQSGENYALQGGSDRDTGRIPIRGRDERGDVRRSRAQAFGLLVA